MQLDSDLLHRKKQPHCDSARKAAQKYWGIQLITLLTDLSCVWPRTNLLITPVIDRALVTNGCSGCCMGASRAANTDEYWWRAHLGHNPQNEARSRGEWGPFLCSLNMRGVNTSQFDNSSCSEQSCSNNRGGFNSVEWCRMQTNKLMRKYTRREPSEW